MNLKDRTVVISGAAGALGTVLSAELAAQGARELRGTGVTANLLLAKAIAVESEKASATAPKELAAAVLYLLSEEAGVINGARIPMYGGYL